MDLVNDGKYILDDNWKFSSLLSIMMGELMKDKFSLLPR